MQVFKTAESLIVSFECMTFIDDSFIIFSREKPRLKRLNNTTIIVIVLRATLYGSFRDADGVDIPNNKDFGYSE